MPSWRHFIAQLLLPLRMGGEFADERGQRRGQRVVRGHHQETHVVDDVLRRQQRAVLMGGLAKLREQVFAALFAADRNLFRKIGDDAFAPVDAACHLGARQRLADHGDRGRHHVDEGTGDVVDFGADIGAEERRGGEIERQLLHRRIEQHRSRLRLPLRDTGRDAGIECGQIGFHRSGFEGDRQRAAVQAMFVEIEQHQAARKQLPENITPAERGGELPGLVEQHQFIGVRPEQDDAGLAEQMGAINQAVFGGIAFDLALGIGQHIERLADQRPAFVARNMCQRIALRRCEAVGGGNHTLHRHGNCSGWSLPHSLGR